MERECKGVSVKGTGLWGENVKRTESVGGECKKEEGSKKIGSVGTGSVWGECVVSFKIVEGECEWGSEEDWVSGGRM